LNFLGSLFTMFFRIPIYLDSLGTVFIAQTLGLKYAIFTSIAGSLLNSLYDSVALYFIPVGIINAVVANYLFSKTKSSKLTKAFILSIPACIASALITAYIFNGVTTSSSSILLQLLRTSGLSLLASTLIIQAITDFADKYIMIQLSDIIIRRIPNDLKMSLIFDDYKKGKKNN
ncbi:MAG: hypothetical protein GXZ08_06345, partial [Tissierellia bacterium]|nr:hypothetical protein [Tissierellia bacterium]